MMDNPRSPAPLPKAARYFNLAVAALVFCAMFAFAVWVIISGFNQPRPEIVRAGGGAILGFGALTLLAAVRSEWRSGTPFQHDRRFILGMALFGIGATFVTAGG